MPKIADAVPNLTETVTIYAYTDGAGQRSARELETALDRCGVEVCLEGTL